MGTRRYPDFSLPTPIVTQAPSPLLFDILAHVTHGSDARHKTRYREAIEALESRVAADDGHPPMGRSTVVMMFRTLITCPTLGRAIECAAEFCTIIHPRGGRLSLSIQDGIAVFEMDSLRHHPSAESCLVDLSGLLAYQQVFSWLIGTPVTLRRVDLAYTFQGELTPLVGLFGAPVTVGASAYRFEFDAAVLDYPVIRKPAELDEFVDGLPCRLWGEADEAPPLHRQIRASLEAALIVGAPMPDLTALASRLHLSESTLRRRLRAEGVNFSRLREDAVREMARHYLEKSDRDIETIALRLGFYDGCAFRRAFRRWYGCAPREIRRASA